MFVEMCGPEEGLLVVVSISHLFLCLLSRRLCLLGSCFLRWFFGSWLLSFLGSSFLGSWFLSLLGGASLLGSLLRDLGGPLLGLGLLQLGGQSEGASSLPSRSSGGHNLVGSNQPSERLPHQDGSLGRVNLVVGQDVFEDGLAGRTLPVSQAPDGVDDHGGVRWMVSRFLGFAGFLRLRDSSTMLTYQSCNVLTADWPALYIQWRTQ